MLERAEKLRYRIGHFETCCAGVPAQLATV